jgi:hypothetical protein
MLYCFDRDLYDVMDDGECTTFSVGPVLTWFVATANTASSYQTLSSSSHHQDSNSNNALLSRLFDAFVASHPLLPLYCSFALLLQHKPTILDDPLLVHRPLQLRPLPDDNEQHGGVDSLIDRALDLMGRLPPNRRLWLVASHYYGDGAIEDLLSTASSNSLLRLVAPESYCVSTSTMSTTTTTHFKMKRKPSSETTTTTPFPRAYIALGRGRPTSPKQQRYKKMLAWILAAVLASLCWGWRRLKSPTESTTDITGAVVVVAHYDETTAESLSPDPLLVVAERATQSPPPLANEEDRDDITAT